MRDRYYGLTTSLITLSLAGAAIVYATIFRYHQNLSTFFQLLTWVYVTVLFAGTLASWSSHSLYLVLGL